ATTSSAGSFTSTATRPEAGTRGTRRAPRPGLGARAVGEGVGSPGQPRPLRVLLVPGPALEGSTAREPPPHHVGVHYGQLAHETMGTAQPSPGYATLAGMP